MNFPDVPFDEKLFESNELLRSYWDRATESKVYEIPEGFLEAEDLRDMTHETFSNEEEKIKEEESKEFVDESEIVDSNFGPEKSELVFEKAAPEVVVPQPIISSTALANTSPSENTKWVIITIGVFIAVVFISNRSERY